MSLHPAAPEDLAGLVTAYQQTTQAVVDLGRTCSRRRLRPPDRLPGLDGQGPDLRTSSGLESWLRTATGAPRRRARLRPRAPRGRQVRRAVGGAAPHDGRIQGRRRAGNHCGETGGAVQCAGHDARQRRAGAWGPAPRGENLRTRILDIWTHEQDIRQALGRPGNLDSGGAAVFMDLLFASLPRLVARNAGIEPGNVVIIDSHRPGGRSGRGVGGGQRRRQAARHPAFTGIAHDATPTTSSPRSPSRRTRSPAAPRAAAGSRTSTTPCTATRTSRAGCWRTSSS